MKRLKFAAKRFLKALNLDVRRTVSENAALQRFRGADPVTFEYLADLPFVPRIEIAIAEARAGVMGFSCATGAAHPLAVAMSAARRETGTEAAGNAVRAMLLRYYESVRPSSGAEIVGLPESEAPGLCGIPLQAWVFPWSDRTAEETMAFRKTCLEEEGLARGTKVSLSDGATFYGPVSERKLALETERVTSLAQSFRQHGFSPEQGQAVEVMGLRAGGTYRWLIVQGQHRIAACSAFGISHVPARVLRVIRREDAQHWPHVVLGTYTVAGAVAVFDRIFAARTPPAAHGWIEQWARSPSSGRRDEKSQQAPGPALVHHK